MREGTGMVGHACRKTVKHLNSAKRALGVKRGQYLLLLNLLKIRKTDFAKPVTQILLNIFYTQCFLVTSSVHFYTITCGVCNMSNL